MATTQERIENILPRLRIIAKKICLRSVGLEADDLLNDAVVAILELAGKNGSLDTVNDAYLCQGAFFKLQQKARSTVTYLKYVEPELISEVDNGELFSNLDLIAVADITVEEEVDERIELSILKEACRHLPQRYQEVVSLLIEGYRPSEVARKFGVDNSRVTQYVTLIKERASFPQAQGV